MKTLIFCALSAILSFASLAFNIATLRKIQEREDAREAYHRHFNAHRHERGF